MKQDLQLLLYKVFFYLINVSCSILNINLMHFYLNLKIHPLDACHFLPECCIWWVLTQNRANTLECARTRERSSKRSTPAKPWADRSDRFRRPVWPVQAGARWKPRTASSGGTPSELVGLLWGRQATQNVFKHRRDEGKKQSRVGKD